MKKYLRPVFLLLIMIILYVFISIFFDTMDRIIYDVFGEYYGKIVDEAISVSIVTLIIYYLLKEIKSLFKIEITINEVKEK